MLHRLTRLQLLRVWMIDHGDGLVLLGMMSIVAVLGAAAVTFAYYPLSSVEHTTGAIVVLDCGPVAEGAKRPLWTWITDAYRCSFRCRIHAWSGVRSAS